MASYAYLPPLHARPPADAKILVRWMQYRTRSGARASSRPWVLPLPPSKGNSYDEDWTLAFVTSPLEQTSDLGLVAVRYDDTPSTDSTIRGQADLVPLEHARLAPPRWGPSFIAGWTDAEFDPGTKKTLQHCLRHHPCGAGGKGVAMAVSRNPEVLFQHTVWNG